LLSDDDIKHVPAITKLVAALASAMPPEMTCRVSLCAPYIYIYFIPTDFAQENFTVEDCHQFVRDISNTLKKMADECRNNATAIQPKPLKKIVSSPGLLPVLKSLSSDSLKSALQVTYEHDNLSVQLPTLSPSNFTAGESCDVKIIKVKERPVIALIRNRREKEMAIELQDVAGHIIVPETWTWEKIRNALDTKTMITGTLIYKSGRWHLSEDAILQPDLLGE
jgi:hypothetical protein